MDKVSYALGLSIGNNFRSSGIDNIDTDDFMRGLKQVLANENPEISYEEAKQVIDLKTLQICTSVTKLSSSMTHVRCISF